MNVLRFLAAAVVGVGVLLGAPLSAQNVSTYSKEAMDNLATMLDKATREGYRMESGTTTIFGGWMPRGQKRDTEPWTSVLLMRSLDPGRTYRVVAAGDNDTIDLDIRILDPGGAAVATDAKVAREAEVTLRPARQQDYTIQLRLYDSRDNCVCVGAILRK